MTKAETIELRIPTYLRGEDNPYPPLSFGRRLNGYNQYPYCMQDDIDIGPGGLRFVPDAKYKAVRLSNGMLEALILPQMNGRLYSLRNLETGREVFYRNNVVKPALVAIRGAWISGGIEFNTPSLGHSVSTVSPVFHFIENGERECAVTVGDVDRCTRQRWQVRMSLKEGRAALDVETGIFNPNGYRERLYYWENAAVPASDDLRFICNSRWTAGGTVKPWPVQDGLDRSLHINNYLPVDHFSYRQDADFFGAYYAKRRVGTYHWGFRHQSSGQKYFSWGMRDDNKIWEGFLTDRDGQYIEIQSGLYQSQSVTDWLEAGETLSFKGSWFGTEDMAAVTWADRDVAISVSEGAVEIFSIGLSGDFLVSIQPDGGGTSLEKTLRMTSGKTTRIESPTLNMALKVSTLDGRTVFLEDKRESRPLPIDISPRNWSGDSSSANTLASAENFEKYHFWLDAMDELKKAKKASVVDSCILLANVLLKTNQIDKALDAIGQGLDRNPGNAGLHSLAASTYIRRFRFHGDRADLWHAKDHCLALRSGGRLPSNAIVSMSLCELFDGRLVYAKELLESVAAELHGWGVALTMLAGIFRRTGDKGGAGRIVTEMPALWIEKAGEIYLSTGDDSSLVRILGEFPKRGPDGIHAVELMIEWLLAYWRLKWFDDLMELARKTEELFPPVSDHPVFNLLIADACLSTGDRRKAKEMAQRAAQCPIDYVFPSRWEDEALLLNGITLADGACKSFEFLYALFLIENGRPKAGMKKLTSFCDGTASGSFRRRANEIIAKWELLNSHKGHAKRSLSSALAEGPFDRRLFLRLDYALSDAHDLKGRIKLHKSIPASILDRGDIALRRASLLLNAGDFEEALDIFLSHKFNQTEGQAGVRRLYVDALLLSGLKHFEHNELKTASHRFTAVMEYPKNIGSASYLGEHSRLARFMLGLIAERQGMAPDAKRLWAGILNEKANGERYVVEGFEANKSSIRSDEFAAVVFASIKLGRENLKLGLLSRIHCERKARNLHPEETATWDCLSLLLSGRRKKAVVVIRKASETFKCSPLPKIFKFLATLVCDNKIL